MSPDPSATSRIPSSSPAAPVSNPFDLAATRAYAAWREHKLATARVSAEQLLVRLQDPYALQPAELDALTECCRRHNMAIYQLERSQLRDKSLVHALGEQLGLVRLDTNLRADEDSITSLEVRPQAGHQYIPYTDKPLSWHTDGYYNTLDQSVRGIIMHCVQPAFEGGDNALIDHELLYIRLRDENPAWVEALMRPGAMTIPANVENGEEIRGAQSGPVFSVDTASGRLHMRYSARQRNIEWAQDELTRQAAARITELLADDTLVVQHRLAAGQGIVCNNVLHRRTAFSDSDQHRRLMYRARYYDRVNNTGLDPEGQ